MSSANGSGEARARGREAPVWIYFALAFGIAWGAIVILVLPSGIPGQGAQVDGLFGAVFVAMASAPPLAAIVVTLATEGRRGLTAFGRRLLAWRAPLGDYAGAVLVVPATATAVLLALSALDPVYTPALLRAENVAAALAFGIFGGLAAGVIEEIGWTNFALNRLLRTRTVLFAGLAVGVLHGLWHGLSGYWAEGAEMGAWYLPYFAVVWVGGIAALRMLIAWLYKRTGSLPVAQLTHASYTGGLLLVWPAGIEPAQTFIWTTVFTVALWAVIGVIFAADRAAFTSRPA